MSNGINKRQNEEKSIMMLAAQRTLYNEARKYSNSLVIVSVILPFICAVLLNFWPNNKIITSMSYLLALSGLIVSFFIDSHVRYRKIKAAIIQQHFDLYVYNMPWDRKLFGEDEDVDCEIGIYSKKLLQKSTERKKLENWYCVEFDNRGLLEGIALCQRENITWDVGLRKRYRMFSSLLISGLIICIFILGIYKNESVYILLSRIIFILPMLKWLLLNVIKNLNEDIKYQENIKFVNIKGDSYSMEDLQFVQKYIYDLRRKSYIIPNFVYNRYKDVDEENAHRVTMLCDR